MKKPVSIPIKLIYWGILTILFFSLSGFPYLAQGAPAGTGQLPFLSPPQSQPTEPDLVEPPPSTRQGPTDLQEVETFLDKFFAKEMPTKHIPGIERHHRWCR